MKQIHNKQTRERISACQALGLHYWSGHPVDGCVWAVDDNQQPVTVRIHRRSKVKGFRDDGTYGRFPGLWASRELMHEKTRRTYTDYWATSTGERVEFKVSDGSPYQLAMTA